MRHRLILIGPLGQRRAYLDMTEDAATARYVATEGDMPRAENVESFEFDDEFCVYDAWLPLAIEEAMQRPPSQPPRPWLSAF